MNSELADLVIGIIGIVLFKFTSQNRRFANWISVFLLGLFLSPIFYLSPNGLVGQILWMISSFGLICFYFLRFKNIEKKRAFDFLKPIALVLLVIYPLPFYSLVPLGENEFWVVLRLSTFYIVGTIFIYDRWILKPETMKKKFVVILAIQAVIILVIFVYAVYLKSQADIATVRAVGLQRDAEKARDEAIELRDELEKLKEDSLKKNNP